MFEDVPKKMDDALTAGKGAIYENCNEGSDWRNEFLINDDENKFVHRSNIDDVQRDEILQKYPKVKFYPDEVGYPQGRNPYHDNKGGFSNTDIPIERL